MRKREDPDAGSSVFSHLYVIINDFLHASQVLSPF
jgi:hypothetical protein